MLQREPPADLQEAFRQLNGTEWEQRGSGAAIHRMEGPPVYFDKDNLARLKWHQGNPEAVAEIIEEARRPKVRSPAQRRPLKPGGGKKRY